MPRRISEAPDIAAQGTVNVVMAESSDRFPADPDAGGPSG
jgi:hypothetical protein